MSPAERIPGATADKFAAITALTDAFCEKHLNDEYRTLIQRVIGSLARKRPSPLLKGKESVWAAAPVHAIGRTNFLDDPSQVPHCKSSGIFEFFGVGESTVISKSKQVRETFGMGPLSPSAAARVHEPNLPPCSRQRRRELGMSISINSWS